MVNSGMLNIIVTSAFSSHFIVGHNYPRWPQLMVPIMAFCAFSINLSRFTSLDRLCWRCHSTHAIISITNNSSKSCSSRDSTISSNLHRYLLTSNI